MDNADNPEESKIQANTNSVAVDNVSIGGSIEGTFIAGSHNVVGFTSDQVSALITQISTTFQVKPFDGRCPYKGLDVFEEEDADLFFGREKLVDDLVGRVKGSRTVFITGPSGSGKSSLVRAGLIHTLKHGQIKNSERWLYATLKPGREPIAELARVASILAGSTNAEDEIRAKAMKDQTIFARWCDISLKEGRDKRVVLFIDQFEEVFTQINAEAERIAFLNLLTHAANTENGRVIVLFSMRSDFVSNCASYPDLNALLNKQFIQIGAMQPGELVSAIALPALRVGLRIDPDLVAQIVNDMEGEPGALPLMQFALKDLFDSQQVRGGVIELTRSDYLHHGGIHKALERHADSSFQKLDEREKELARSIFGGLIEIGRGTQDTRRTALFDELIPANAKAEEVEAIMRKLADARLITTDEQAGKDTVTISHEKLIDAWPWLNRLVNENRDVIALQNEITSDAKEWQDRHRDASYLYTGARLIKAREELAAKKLVLTELAEEFVITAQARQRRGQVVAISGVAILIGLLVFAVIFFSRLSTQNAQTAAAAQAASTSAVAQQLIAQAANTKSAASEQQAIEAQADLTSNLNETTIRFRKARNQSLSAQSEQINKDSPSASILLALEAIKLNQEAKEPVTYEAYQALRDALANTQGIPVEGNSEAVLAMQYSKDGHWFATGGRDGLLRVWDTKQSQVAGTPALTFDCNQGEVQELFFSEDGSRLTSRGSNKTICVWDMSTPDPTQTVRQLEVDLPALDTFTASPDGRWAAAGNVETNQVVIWNLESGQTFGSIDISNKPAPGLLELAFNPAGTILLVGNDSTITFWSIEGTGPERMPSSGLVTLDGKGLGGLSEIHVRHVQFTPNGRSVVGLGTTCRLLDCTWRTYEGVFIFETADLRTVPKLPLSTQNINISPDGHWIAGGSYYNTILVSDLKLNHNPLQLDGHQAGVNTLVFSNDGRWLASATGVQGDGTVRLWDLSAKNPAEAPIIIPTSLEKNTLLAFDAQTNWLAISSEDQLVRLFDLTTKKFSIEPLEFSNTQVRFAPLYWASLAGNPALNWLVPVDYAMKPGSLNDIISIPPTILAKLSPEVRIYGNRPDPHGTQLVYDLCADGLNCELFEIDVSQGGSATPRTLISAGEIIPEVDTISFTSDHQWMIVTAYIGSDIYYNGLYLVDLRENSPGLRKENYLSSAGGYVFSDRWLFASTDAGLTYLDLTAPDPVASRKFISGIYPRTISPDGRWLAGYMSASGNLGLLDLSQLEKGSPKNVNLNIPVEQYTPDLAFSSDSRWLTLNNDESFYLWDLSRAETESPALSIPMNITYRTMSLDQHWLGLLDGAGDVTLVELSGNAPVIREIQTNIPAGGYVDIAFSPDNRWFVTLDRQGVAYLYDLPGASSEPLIPNRALNALASLSFNSDKGNIMLAGGTTNGKILLWNMNDLLSDVNTSPIVLQGGVKAYDEIAFTPDNSWILAYGSEEPLKAWRAKFEEVMEFACAAAGRNLTPSEWTKYGFTEAYRKTCEQWSLASERISITPTP